MASVGGFNPEEWNVASEVDEYRKMVKFVIFRVNKDGSRDLIGDKHFINTNAQVIHIPFGKTIDVVHGGPTISVPLKEFEKAKENGDANP